MTDRETMSRIEDRLVRLDRRFDNLESIVRKVVDELTSRDVEAIPTEPAVRWQERAITAALVAVVAFIAACAGAAAAH